MENVTELNIEQVETIDKTRDWLMEQVDLDNLVEVEKVDRYCNLLKIFYYLDNDVYARGPVIEVGNGKQGFIKPNPALAEKNKINGSLLAIEKSFQLDKKAEQRRLEEAQKGPELT